MEPMTLGSPTHSPSGSPNVGYLPPFLLGEMNPPATPRTNSLSPTKGRSLAFGSPTKSPQTSTPDHKSYRQNISMHQQALFNQQNIFANVPTSPNTLSFNNKSHGPPTEDLFDTIKSNEPSFNKSVVQDHSFLGYGNNFNQNSYMNGSVNQSLPPWQEVSQDSDEHWVTVFGFPPNVSNTILARFSSCGAILDKQYPTQGNWAHIRYSTRTEKERALALSGRHVLPNIMIGVVECKDPPRLNCMSPNNTLNTSERLTSNARSLCPTPIPNAPLPQRSNGLLSKALDYVLGW